MKLFRVLIAVCLVIPMPAFAQIYDMRELATEDIENLDLDRTAIIIPGDILEQHGPYLPSYSDGYKNEYLVGRVAEAIVQRDGWTVLVFPPIPLGVGGANQVGKQQVFPGTYHVHFSTMRAIYMDLASEFGEAGFRWVFTISDHGAPQHQLALDQAGDFFADTYGGEMVYLTGIIPNEPVVPVLGLSDEENAMNGFDIHSGMAETSQILFLRPDLARPGLEAAAPEAGNSWRDLVDRGGMDEWPGYFGAPALATAARGARIMDALAQEHISLALRILDGFDHRTLRRWSAVQLEDEAIRDYNDAAIEHAEVIQQVQGEWLENNGLQ